MYALSRERGRAIFGLALPIIAGMGSQNLLNLVDVAMLGRLGEAQVAAVGLCSIFLWVLTALMQGFSPAVQAITARRMGEGRKRDLHVSAVTSIYMIIVVGIPISALLIQFTPEIFTLLTDDPAVRNVGIDYLTIRLYTVVIIGFNLCFRGYFNGLKKSTVYMKTLMAMHALNLIANYVLIFGKAGMPALGAQGAALGTALATTLGCLIFFVLMLKHRNPGFSLSPMVVTPHIVAKVLRVGLPACVQSMAMALGFLVFFRLAASISTTALAATNILININLICILLAVGMGMATLTLVSNALGEEKPQEAIAWMKHTTVLTALCLTVVGLILAAFPTFWLGLFLPDPNMIAIATVPLVMMGISQIYDGAGIVMSYAHLGGGASKRVMLIAIANQWFLFLPACFIWVRYFDGQLLHLWICMVTYRLLLTLCFTISIRGKHWLGIRV